MKELIGRYGTAKVFTDLVEDAALEQITTLLNQDFISGSKIRIMPDVHAGAGCTIGTTMTITDKVCPNLVGVDIGCGMKVMFLGQDQIDLDLLDRVIREKIPFGFNVHDDDYDNKYYSFIVEDTLEELKCRDHVNLKRAELSLGTLGGGNHFIEVNKDDNGRLYLVIHSGSRHLGLEVAKYYQQLAEKQVCGNDKKSVQRLISKLKSQGRHKDISNELKKLKSATADIPRELAYVSGQLFDDYIHDMSIVQYYASLNRSAIWFEIATAMHIFAFRSFETVHNYIDVENHILRKGAVSAEDGQLLIIPMNMRDGSLICKGKGNPDWNYSAPHGAGRLMSRAAAKKTFTVEEFARSMDGIYTTSIGEDTLDECPMAYKPMESIVENIRDTVEIEQIIRPIYNFKAGA